MKLLKIVIIPVVLASIIVWQLVTFEDDKFHLVSCSVGQGDATLLFYKSTQILIDGGPTGKVIDCLSKYMPFWDREIELVILTHPEKDHYSGLIDVFKRYKMDTFLRNRLAISSQDYKLLEKLVGGGGVRVVEPQTGMVMRLGLIRLDIVIDEENLKKGNITHLNNYSILTSVKYADFEALLTGDMEFEGKEKVLGALTSVVPNEGVEYIKIPHHGSRNGLTQELLEITRPKLAIISVGKNQWGHPVPEILKMLGEFNVKILRTDKEGDIEIISDGKSSWILK
jgi:competence protein ComEC